MCLGDSLLGFMLFVPSASMYLGKSLLGFIILVPSVLVQYTCLSREGASVKSELSNNLEKPLLLESEKEPLHEQPIQEEDPAVHEKLENPSSHELERRPHAIQCMPQDQSHASRSGDSTQIP